METPVSVSPKSGLGQGRERGANVTPAVHASWPVGRTAMSVRGREGEGGSVGGKEGGREGASERARGKGDAGD